MQVAVDFYKKLFAAENRGNAKLGNNFWNSDDCISNRENELLQAPFLNMRLKRLLIVAMQKGPRS